MVTQGEQGEQRGFLSYVKTLGWHWKRILTEHIHEKLLLIRVI